MSKTAKFTHRYGGYPLQPDMDIFVGANSQNIDIKLSN